jgi:hypothetical protein
MYAAAKAACEESKEKQHYQCEATKQSLLLLNAQIALECHKSEKLDDFTTDKDTDRPNKGDYYHLAAPNLAVCQQLCRQDLKCTAYSFLPIGAHPKDWRGPSPPHCWLKSAVPERTVYTGFISGVRAK